MHQPIIMLDSSAEGIERARPDLPEGFVLGQLLTPLSGYKDAGAIYGIDNGAYSTFDRKKWTALVNRQATFGPTARRRCKFVCMPDVVCSAIRTLELFHIFKAQLSTSARCLPLCLVLQNGIENHAIPWNDLSAIFIGGDNDFKGCAAVAHAVKAAQHLGLWTHMGRVNGPERYDLAVKLKIDSIDGTGLVKYSHMRQNVTKMPILDACEKMDEVAI